MRIRTLLLYLIGDRQAILDIAADRRSLGIGFLFVLSAAFAREYDGKDLLAEPWHLAIPFAASFLSSFFLFVYLDSFTDLSHLYGPSLWYSYRSFLSLFWMTAPLAWVYAIPFERFMTPVGALQANLTALGLVALWRVLLMVRVAAVLTGRRWLTLFFLVMCFADIEVLVISFLIPVPVFHFMGGVRLSPADRLLQALKVDVIVIGLVSLPAWLIGAIIASCKESSKEDTPNLAHAKPAPPGRGLLYLAWASVVVWAPVLPFTQAEQRLRSRVEQDFKEGRIVEALAEMSAHAQNDFPPQWDPPPRVAYGQKTPPFLDVIEEIANNPPAPWVRSLYLQRFDEYLDAVFGEYPFDPQSAERSPPDLDKIAELLLRLPEGVALVAERREAVERTPRIDYPMNTPWKEKLRKLLQVSVPAGKGEP
jgi:hypothetical protein